MVAGTFLLGALLLTGGCFGLSGNRSSTSKTGTLQLYITDAAANDLKEVNVRITSIEVHRDGRWEILNDFAPVGYLDVNLLDLRFDQELLGTATLPAGLYTQIRLIVDDACPSTNVLDGEGRKPLKVPSGPQTGLKIGHTFRIPPGRVVSLVMDADVRRFVHRRRMGQDYDYIMQPTAIRVADHLATGTVVGRVVDKAAKAPITDTDVVVTLRRDADGDGSPDDIDGDGVYDPETDFVVETLALREALNGHIAGEFSLNAVPVLPTGSYILEVSADGYAVWAQTDIVVMPGSVVHIDGEPETAGIDDIPLVSLALGV